jgi:DNA-binding beta-propeller fold protein YncE
VPGALVRISDNGQTATTLPAPGLYQPTGVAVSAEGTVYVSNYGDSTTASSQADEIVEITGLS